MRGKRFHGVLVKCGLTQLLFDSYEHKVDDYMTPCPNQFLTDRPERPATHSQAQGIYISSSVLPAVCGGQCAREGG